MLVILAIMPALAIILYTGLEQRQHSIEDAQKDVMLLTHTMAEAQQDFTRSIKQMLAVLSLLPEIQSLDQQPCNNVFRSVLEQNSKYINIALTDLNGDVLASGKPLTVTNFSDRKHVRSVLKSNQFSIGEYIISRVGSGMPAIAFAYPVLDSNNQLKAILTTATKLPRLSDFHKIANLPKNSFIAVTDHKGIRLFYYPPKEDTNPVGKPIKKQSWEKAKNAIAPGIFTGSGSDGVRRIFAFEQVRFKPEEAPYLYVWTGTPESYALASANTALIRNLLLLILATALSLFISWLIGRKTLLSPIQNLVYLTKKYSQGDLKARSELTTKSDEFGTLTKAFHDMADTLATNQKTLKENEERFRTLVEESPMGISLIGRDGRYKYVNPSFKMMFGYTIDDIPSGKDWFEKAFPNEEMRQEVIDTWIKNKQETSIGQARPQEYTVTCKDGTRKEIHFRPVTLKSADQFVIYEDITDKRIMERQLQQSQKMEAIGTLAGGIAHDFNNLLMGIQGRTSLMINDANLSQDYSEHLRGIEEYVKSATDLTKQLLGFARGGKYEVKPSDINELLERSSQMFGRTKKEIRIHRKLQEDLWTTDVDRSQIEQVLLNLYVNAWQAMPQGGELYLQTENVILDENYVQPYYVDPGKYIKISITDTGIGMDEDTREKIFDPFFTTKALGRGTGLGLASVYGIIKNHGGSINVYSEVGEGTTFTLYLPASDKQVAQDSEHYEKILKGTETILLVDDENMIIDVGKAMLERLGYQVVIANGGQQAIEILSKQEGVIDLVILDLIMPKMDGGKTFDHIRKIQPSMPVILSSGYAINGQANEIMDRGCNGFIQKPFNLSELSQKIRQILEEAKKL